MSALMDIDSLDQVLVPTREQILTLETRMRQFDPIDCPLTHTFAPGSYARGIQLPAGALVVGKIHKHAHLNVVSRGLVTVVTEFGRMEIDAREHPVTFTSQPGTKRALYVHEETWWTTVHLTNSSDLAEIERELIAPSYAELDAALARACVELIESETREVAHAPPGTVGAD